MKRVFSTVALVLVLAIFATVFASCAPTISGTYYQGDKKITKTYVEFSFSGKNVTIKSFVLGEALWETKATYSLNKEKTQITIGVGKDPLESITLTDKDRVREDGSKSAVRCGEMNGSYAVEDAGDKDMVSGLEQTKQQRQEQEFEFQENQNQLGESTDRIRPEGKGLKMMTECQISQYEQEATNATNKSEVISGKSNGCKIRRHGTEGSPSMLDEVDRQSKHIVVQKAKKTDARRSVYLVKRRGLRWCRWKVQWPENWAGSPRTMRA